MRDLQPLYSSTFTYNQLSKLGLDAHPITEFWDGHRLILLRKLGYIFEAGSIGGRRTKWHINHVKEF